MTSTTADGPPSPGADRALTPRQRTILRFIHDWVHERGYSPSMREIGRAVGLTSTSSVEHQLSALETKGHLRREPGCPRTVEVRLPGVPPVSAKGPADAKTAGPAPRRTSAREATVKTLKRSGGHVWLMPHNTAYTPILGDTATILGRVVTVLRRV